MVASEREARTIISIMLEWTFPHIVEGILEDAKKLVSTKSDNESLKETITLLHEKLKEWMEKNGY